MGDLGSIPGLGRDPGEGKGYPLQYSGLENSVDCIDHRSHKESDMTEQLSLTIYTDHGLGVNMMMILEALELRSVGQLPCLQVKICETDFCGCHAPLFLQYKATF